MDRLADSLVAKIESGEVVPFISAMLLYYDRGGYSPHRDNVHTSYIEGIYNYKTKQFESGVAESLRD